MFHVHDIREIRVYREGLEEGMEKGLEKGFAMALEYATARLAGKKIADADATAMLEWDVALVQQVNPPVTHEPGGNAGQLPEGDIRRTRFYQEAVEDGIKKGIAKVEQMEIENKIVNVIEQAFEKGVKTCIAFVIAKLAAKKKMAAEEIAASLELDVEFVRQILATSERN